MGRPVLTPPTGINEPRFFYGYVIVIVGFFIMAIMWGTIYCFGVFMKPMTTDLGWTRAVTSGAYSLYMVLHGFLYIFTGRLNDRFGPRIVMVGCGVFLGVGYLLMSQIIAVWQLYLFYGVIISIGMSGGFVPVLSTVVKWFVKRRGLMTGIIVAGIGVGIVTIPPVVSRLISSYGWHNAYLVIGLISLILITLAAQFLKSNPGHKQQLANGESDEKTESSNLEAVGLTFYEAIHTKQFWIICALFMFYAIGQQATMVHIVPNASDLGISDIAAANILSVIGVLTIIGTLAIGSISDRIGIKPTLIISLIFAIVVLFWLASAMKLWMFYLLAVVFGLSFGGMITLQPLIIAELFGLKTHGVIFGTAIFSLTIGCAIGPVVAGHIFDISGSYYLAFITCGVLSLISLILASLLKPAYRREQT